MPGIPKQVRGRKHEEGGGQQEAVGDVEKVIECKVNPYELINKDWSSTCEDHYVWDKVVSLMKSGKK